jgi:ankyrin repeat protein
MLAAYAHDGRALPVHEHYGTLLHFAASYGSEAVAQILLAGGLSVHTGTRSGATPLHHARNQPAMVRFLLAAGADVNARTIHGHTPLHLSEGTTQMLLNAGADAQALDEKGQTAMFQSGVDVAALVKAGLDVNARDKQGWTPLHVAAFYAQADHAKALLDAGADIEAKTLTEFVMRKTDAWTSEERSIPAGNTALDIAYNEHDRVKWVTGRNRPTIDLLRAHGATRPFFGLRFLRW